MFGYHVPLFIFCNCRFLPRHFKVRSYLSRYALEGNWLADLVVSETNNVTELVGQGVGQNQACILNIQNQLMSFTHSFIQSLDINLSKLYEFKWVLGYHLKLSFILFIWIARVGGLGHFEPRQSGLRTHKFANPASKPRTGAPNPAQALRTPAQVLQTPAQVLRTPAKVLQTPAKVLRTPAKVLRTPAKVLRTPAKVLRTTAQVVPSHSKLFSILFFNP